MQDREAVIFEQRTRLGQVTFKLNDHRLLINGNRGPTKIHLDVDLRDVAPHFERRIWRSYVMIGLPLAVACVTALLTWSLRFQQTVPYEPLLLIGAIVTAGFIWTAFQNLAPIEFVTFRSKSGVPVFDVVKAKNQATDFEEFVSRLEGSVRSSEIGEKF